MTVENLPLILEVRDEHSREKLGEIAIHNPKVGDEVYCKYGKGIVMEFTEAREEGFFLAGQPKALRVNRTLGVKLTHRYESKVQFNDEEVRDTINSLGNYLKIAKSIHVASAADAERVIDARGAVAVAIEQLKRFHQSIPSINKLLAQA